MNSRSGGAAGGGSSSSGKLSVDTGGLGSEDDCEQRSQIPLSSSSSSSKSDWYGGSLERRAALAMVSCPPREIRRRLYAIGGWRYGTLSCGDMERFDPSRLRTRATTPPPMVVVAPGEVAVVVVVVVGGSSSSGSGDGGGAWTLCAPLGTARRLHGAAVAGGRVYVFGGNSDDETDTARVESYDFSTDSWTPRRPLPTGSCCAAATVRWPPPPPPPTTTTTTTQRPRRKRSPAAPRRANGPDSGPAKKGRR